MKKNKALTAAISVLSLTMVSLCAIGGTFAKYTTNDSAADTATVAKWGIELTVTGDEVLYDDDKTTNDVTSVKVNANNLAAPGTYQKLATVTLTGTPQVAFEVVVTPTLELTGWEVDITNDGNDNPVEYCPLVFTVGGTEYKIDGSSITTVDGLESAVIAAIEENVGEGSYEPNDTLNKNVLVDWKWVFEGENVKDTALGNKDSAPTISFGLDVTVTQVD